MDIVVFVVGVIIVLFSFVVFFGAPYVPTLKNQVVVALDGLDLKPGQTLIEVGSGDGRILIAAAERGWNAVGYELNPILVLWAWWRTRKCRKNVKIIWGNALTKKWPPTDAVYVFGVARIMPKLHKKIIQSIDTPIKVASFGFEIPGAHKIATLQAVHLYEYSPAP
jgi:hypothetical protein